MWIAIYKFKEYGFITVKQVPVAKWLLHTKKAQSEATKYSSAFTPMETAYQIDDGHEWFFKTF